jgi:ABC-type amino acid transport substrate-binding protein
MRSILVFTLLLGWSFCSQAQNNAVADSSATSTTINLATNISSGFSPDSPAGASQDLQPRLQCIFKQLGRDYKVQVMPWRRAYQDVKNNRIDGFFTAIPMRAVDPYAVLSSPLVLENWYWFWRTDTIAPESWRDGYKLGSILGSQQETWLGEAGYKVDMSANNLPQLIKLLQNKRIDVILANHDSFVLAAQELKIDDTQFQSRFFRYVPLGIYFNEQLLKANPNFLLKFNQQITGCSPARFAVSGDEQQRIKELLARKIERWKDMPKLQALLQERNLKSRRFSKQEIAERDKKWNQAFLENDFSYSIALVDQEMSAQLREIKKQSQDMVTEIIVTDARGLNFAISDMTSDYWQGDETKFTEVFAKPANTIHFSEISYDESTKRFQIDLSVPLYSAGNLEPLGVMVFGLDVEKVLSQAQ